MKRKFVATLIICFLCFTLILSGCSVGGSSNSGGDISGLIEDPNTGYYDSGEDYLSAYESYSGFTIVEGTDSDIQVADIISGTTMLFSDLVSRQIDKFVEDLLIRLDSVWGVGFSVNRIIISESSYSLTIDDTTYYAVVKDGDEIIREEDGSYIWNKADGTSVTVSESDTSFDVSNPATFALRDSNFDFLDAINGGSYWNADTSDFTGTVEDSLAYVWAVSTGVPYSITADNILKTELKLAIANILAYGDYDGSSNLSQCIADVDHLGFLQIDDSTDSVDDEVEKISDYILENVIGSAALVKDLECLAALTSSLTNNTLDDMSILSDFAHNYRGYELLVPEMVKTATTNTFATMSEETVIYSDYLVYPSLPKVVNEDFEFEDSDEQEDFIWMENSEEIKSITFMPKTDVSVIAFMLAFETKGWDSVNGWQNITVELQVTFTLVSNGQKILDNAVVSGLGAEDGLVEIGPGVYNADTNDNSAIFNVSNVVKDALSSLPTGVAETIPSNGVVTVGTYDGHNPDSIIDLYCEDYTVYPNDSGVGSIASLNAGDNYIQLNFSVVNAAIIQGETSVPFTGKVMLKIAVGDPIS